MSMPTNDIILYLQCSITTIGLIFSGTMLIIGNNPNIYLPIFSSLIFSWMPSPISAKVNSDFHQQQSTELSNLHSKVLTLTTSQMNSANQMLYASVPNSSQQQNANVNPSVVIPINSGQTVSSSTANQPAKTSYKIV